MNEPPVNELLADTPVQETVALELPVPIVVRDDEESSKRGPGANSSTFYVLLADGASTVPARRCTS